MYSLKIKIGILIMIKKQMETIERIDRVRMEYGERKGGKCEKQAGDPHEERKRNVEGGLKSKWAREDRSTDRNAQ